MATKRKHGAFPDPAGSSNCVTCGQAIEREYRPGDTASGYVHCTVPTAAECEACWIEEHDGPVAGRHHAERLTRRDLAGFLCDGHVSI